MYLSPLVQGVLLRQLQSFLATATAQGYTPLPSAKDRAQALQDAAQALVYDVLMQKVCASLSAVSSLFAVSGSLHFPNSL